MQDIQYQFDTEILLPTDSNIQMCAERLMQGDIVAFGTETVYGLGANIYNESAVERVFEIKKRPCDNPLIVHVHSLQQIYKLSDSVDTQLLGKLYDAFMPGALTLVLPKSSQVPDIVTGGADTVACRIPSNITALRLLQATNVPICAPSANTSTRPSPTQASHVYDDLQGKIRYILQSDCDCSIGIESTILDMSHEMPSILRYGAVSVADMQRVLGKRIETIVKSNVVSPGTKYRHYAPKIPLYYLSNLDIVQVQELIRMSDSVVLCAHDVSLQLRDCSCNCDVIDMGDPQQYATRLYATLRDVENNYQQIIAIGVLEDGIGAALNNRLHKASGG
ncbi:MAG: threonylcarbamoyl-AMP synthase [Clostridiales bacterium]|jgi:L-threonylcarbamoyladenylate synthase|nr:threonylcarbamoyl-AMP synthase [Clostridiales bacterium]